MSDRDSSTERSALLGGHAVDSDALARRDAALGAHTESRAHAVPVA